MVLGHLLPKWHLLDVLLYIAIGRPEKPVSRRRVGEQVTVPMVDMEGRGNPGHRALLVLLSHWTIPGIGQIRILVLVWLRLELPLPGSAQKQIDPALIQYTALEIAGHSPT